MADTQFEDFDSKQDEERIFLHMTKKQLYITGGAILAIIVIIVIIVVCVTTTKNEESSFNNDPLPSPEPGYLYSETEYIGNGGGGVLRYGVISPLDNNVMAITSDMGSFYITKDNGKTWNRQNVLGTSGYPTFHPTKPGVIYTTSSTIYKSTDYGETAEMIYPPKDAILKHNTKYEYNIHMIYTDSTKTAYEVGTFCKFMLIDPENDQHIFSIWDKYNSLILYETNDEFKTMTKLVTEENPQVDMFKVFYSSKTRKFYAALGNNVYDTSDTSNPISTISNLKSLNQLADGTFVILTTDGFNSQITGHVYYTNDFYTIEDISNNFLNSLDTEFNSVTMEISLTFVAGESLNDFAISVDGSYGSGTALGIVKVNNEAHTATFAFFNYDRENNPAEPFDWVQQMWCLVTTFSLEYMNGEYIFGTLMGVYKLTMEGKTIGLHSKKITDTTFQTTGCNEITTYFTRTDPFDKNHLFMAVTDFLLMESKDNGQTWCRSTSGIPDPYQNTVYDLQFHPSKKDTIYIAVNSVHDMPYTFPINSLLQSSGGFGISTDGGITYSFENNLPSNVVPLRMQIIDNGNSDPTIYLATFKDGFFKSIDGGKTFTKLNDGLTPDDGTYYLAQDIVVKDSRIFGLTGILLEGDSAYTQSHVWELKNNRWEEIETGFGSIRSIAYDEKAKRLYAGVMGRYSNWPEQEHITSGLYYYNEVDSKWINLTSETTPIFGVTAENGVVMGTMYPGTLFKLVNDEVVVLTKKLFAGIKFVSYSPDENIVYVSSFGGGTARVTLKRSQDLDELRKLNENQKKEFYTSFENRWVIDPLPAE